MPAPRKFDEETRARPVRLHRDRVEEHGDSKVEARRLVGALLDTNPATIRNWVEAEERAAGSRPPASRQADAEEVRALKRRVVEFERANEILKTDAQHAPHGRRQAGYRHPCSMRPGTTSRISPAKSSRPWSPVDRQAVERRTGVCLLAARSGGPVERRHGSTLPRRSPLAEAVRARKAGEARISRG